MNNFNQVVSNFVNNNTTRNLCGLRTKTMVIDEAPFISAMKIQNNYKQTENGAVAKKSTMSKLYDLFALGGAYRSRTESECILLFKEAYQENKEYALKCLWYLRDILEGKLVA